jgi:hypothetical protein
MALQTRKGFTDGGTVVTFENGDELVVYVGQAENRVLFSTYGAGYNGAVRMTVAEASELCELVQSGQEL